MSERTHWLAIDDESGDHRAACGANSDDVIVNPLLVTCLRCKRSKAWQQPGDGQEKNR